MPLLHDASDESVSRNIEELISAGHPRKQAVAIALDIQRKARGEDVSKAIHYSMPLEDAIKEHEELVRVLKSPTKKDDAREAKEQGQELAEMKQEVGKADRGPTNMLTEHEVRGRAHEKEPTPGQHAANNYPHHHWKINGLDIAIENPAGTTRKGIDEQGNAWETVMPYHYGYIKRSEGADGDHLDCCIGPLMGNGTEAHIVNQNRIGGGFDEHKVMLGYPTREDAIAAYKAGHTRGNEIFGGAITVPVKELKRWIAEGNLDGEAVLKAAVAHVKAHYRVVNGKVVYIPNYDRATHGDHREATLQERTAAGFTEGHGNYLRATDAEDARKIEAAAAAEGVTLRRHAVQGTHVSANHHGRRGAYQTFYHDDPEVLTRIHDRLAGPQDEDENFRTPTPARNQGPQGEDENFSAPRPAQAPEPQSQDEYDRAHGLDFSNQPTEPQDEDEDFAPPQPVAEPAHEHMTVTQAQVEAHQERPATPAEETDRQASQEREQWDAMRPFFAEHPAGMLHRRVHLENTTGTHNKQYILDLRQVGPNQFVVNAGNGRIGARAFTVRTKTSAPMSRAAANALVSRIAREKVGEGYVTRDEASNSAGDMTQPVRPRLQFTPMDNFVNPGISRVGVAQHIATNIAASNAARTATHAAQASGGGVSQPIRPTPGARPDTGPTGGPDAGATPPPAATPRITPAMYDTHQREAHSIGTSALNGGNDFEGVQAATNALTAHRRALESAIATNAPGNHGNHRGAEYHQGRVGYWQRAANERWQAAMTAASPNAILNTAAAQGTGFQQALQHLDRVKDLVRARPEGARLPSNMTQAQFDAVSSGVEKTRKALESGAALETAAAGANTPQAKVHKLAEGIRNLIRDGHIPADHRQNAEHIASALEHAKTIHAALEGKMAEPDATADELETGARALTHAIATANDAMTSAPADLAWRKVPHTALAGLATIGAKATEQAKRISTRPTKAHPGIAGLYEQHQQEAATAHHEASQPNAPRAATLRAIEAHKNAAVSAYHKGLAQTEKDERNRLHAKAREHAEHAKAFAANLTARR